MSEPDVDQQRPEQLEKDIKALDWRDLQLWGIGTCVLVVLAAGFLLLLAPQLIGKFSNSTESTNLHQYAGALIALLLLLNVHTLHQRLRLQRVRRELVRRLQLAERGAQLDSLTGAFNRRYMETALEKEIQRAERYDARLSLAVIDVDRLKNFNTRFGHLEDDRVLAVVAHLLRKNFRAADTVVRWGGDEFIILMPETDTQATVAVKRLQKRFAQWNRANSNCGYAITATYGLAEFKRGMTARQLIHEADGLMLAAKSQGMGEGSSQTAPISNRV
jgi:diguanylate cyclase (GGDEF)-like protein